MSLLLDSFWRALAYCLHKRVIVWSLLPLLAMALMAWLLGYFFWADTVLKVQSLLDGVGWLHSLWLWLQGLGLGYASEVVASIFVVLGAMPVLVVLVLLVVALAVLKAVFMPLIVTWVLVLVVQILAPAVINNKG